MAGGGEPARQGPAVRSALRGLRPRAAPHLGFPSSAALEPGAGQAEGTVREASSGGGPSGRVAEAWESGVPASAFRGQRGAIKAVRAGAAALLCGLDAPQRLQPSVRLFYFQISSGYFLTVAYGLL